MSEEHDSIDEDLLASYERTLAYINFQLTQTQKNLSRVERGSSYFLSFFGTILPLAVFLGPTKEFLMNSPFASHYFVFYFGSILAAIGALFPWKAPRATAMSFGIKSEPGQIKRDLSAAEKVAGLNWGAIKVLNDTQLKGETLSRLSYLYLIALFVFFGIDLAQNHLTDNLLDNLASPLALVTVVLVTTYLALRTAWDEIKEYLLRVNKQ